MVANSMEMLKRVLPDLDIKSARYPLVFFLACSEKLHPVIMKKCMRISCKERLLQREVAAN